MIKPPGNYITSNSKSLLGTILLVTANLAALHNAQAQALPEPTRIATTAICWGQEDGRRILTELLKGPYKPLLEAREGDGTTPSKIVILADSSDGEIFLFRVLPAGLCLMGQGFIEKLAGKVFKGI